MKALAGASPASPGLTARVRVERRGFTLDADVDAAAGETVAVMGPSGAGKSTLLAALAGLAPLADGEVRVGDRVLDAATPRPSGRGRPRRIHVPPSRRGVVLLGQDPRLFPHLSVRENVAFGPRAQGVAATQTRADADEWLWRVGLSGWGDHRPGELSGGQQQRVAIARALATAPDALLLDEPLTSLDPETAGGIRDVLRELLHTAVVVTHDALDAVALAQRLVVVEHGRVVQSGAVRDVLAAPATAYVAAIAGVNRVPGTARGGVWVRDDVRLEATDAASRDAAAQDGVDLIAVFAPRAARLIAVDEVAAGRAGEWVAEVRRLDPTPAGVRVRTDLGDVDIPVDAAAGLVSGTKVGVRIAAEDVRLRRV
jgi:molybdate transport system ATP-binding protein